MKRAHHFTMYVLILILYYVSNLKHLHVIFSWFTFIDEARAHEAGYWQVGKEN